MSLALAKNDEYFRAAANILKACEKYLMPLPDSIVLFGSFVSGTTHECSDIDLLIVGNQIPFRPFDRAVWVRPVIESWRAQQKIEFPNFPRVLSILSLSKDGFRNSLGLTLSLSQQAWILRDNGLFSCQLDRARSLIQAGQWQRRDLKHGGWMWVPSKEQERVND